MCDGAGGAFGAGAPVTNSPRHYCVAVLFRSVVLPVSLVSDVSVVVIQCGEVELVMDGDCRFCVGYCTGFD